METIPNSSVAVPGYNGRYVVTPSGDVWSRLKQWRKRKPAIGMDGYARIILSDGKGHHTHYVHRLVAMAFVSGDTSLTVNHIDMNKLNNRADNLEWISHADNLAKARAITPWKPSDESLAKRRRKVVCTKDDGAQVVYDSISGAAKAINGDAGCICVACKTGRRFYGCEWCYT